jgi:hypothetical protein
MLIFKRAVSLLGLVTLTVSFCSCAGIKPLIAARPNDETYRTELKKEMSILNVPIETSSDELGKAINQMISTEIYKGSTGTSGLKTAILRNGPIAVSAADNYLYLTLPITMSLRYGFFSTPAIPLKLKFKIGAKVTPDWKLNAEIYYMGLTDLMAEEIGIGPLSIKPRSTIEGITQPVQRVLSEAISKQINNKFPLKSQVASVWQAAQKPILLNKNYNAWLKITPQEVMLYPLYAQNNQFKISVGIKSIAELVVGPEPATQPAVALPNLKLVNTMARDFRIALKTDLFYKEILHIASPLLLNKDFGSDGKSCIVRGLDVYGNGDRLVIKLIMSGSLDGVFYLTCTPRFNPETNMFSVEDVDFDMNTESLLLQSADWFLHGSIKSTIQQKLNVDLTQKLEDSRELARKAIARVKLADHIFLKGTIKSVKLGDVMVQKDKISIQLYTEGETGIFFQ